MMPPNRKNIIIGGNFRAKVLKEMGIKDVPVVYITVSDLKKESEIIIRLNKNVGEFDLDLLKDFDEAFLADIGFDSQSLDNIFAVDPTPEQFNIKKELEKLNIMEVKIFRLEPPICRIELLNITHFRRHADDRPLNYSR